MATSVGRRIFIREFSKISSIRPLVRRSNHSVPNLLRYSSILCRHLSPNFSLGDFQGFARHLSAGASPPAPASSIVEARGSDLVLSPPALVVTREYEWGNIILGFEQANKYTIRAAPGGEVVGYIAEEDSIGKTITRNVLRTRRSFRATVLDKHGDPVFVLRRPFYMISSAMYVERPDGSHIGEIQMRWHVYRRRYDMYVDKEQFAHVDSGFLAVDFDMRDEQERKIASVNKDFTGFAREIFTDARQYVLRLDPSMGVDASGLVNDTNTIVGAEDPTLAGAKLTVDQRAVLLATAISIDFDYFSLHSRSPMPIPMPIPAGGMGGGAGSAGAMAGADVAAGALSGENDEFDDGLGPVDGDSVNNDGFVNNDSFPNEEAPTGDFAPPDNANNEWGKFEEPDYGFQDDPSDDDDWGSGSGGDSGEGGGSFFDVLSDIFSGDD